MRRVFLFVLICCTLIPLGVQSTDAMTRGEAAQLFYEHGGSVPHEYLDLFSDIPIFHPHAEAISWLAQQGITHGAGEELYLPERLITKGEFSLMLQRYVAANGMNMTWNGWEDGTISAEDAALLIEAAFARY